MTLDRKDYKSAIPQLEKRIAQVEKIGKEAQNKFDDIAHQTQLDAAEAEKKVLALDYQMTTTRVQMEYQLQTTGLDPVEANWQTTMPSITYNSYRGKTLWYRSKTYVNDIVVQTTEPMTVNLMDGVYAFVNTVSGNTGWTTIDGDTIQTGKITSHDGNCYFDIDNNNFQMKDNSTLASSTNALAWDNGQLYIKGKIAIGNTTTEKTYYTEMTGGGFDIVANDVNLAHIGYGSCAAESGTAVAPYYAFGVRTSGDVGTRSFTAGRQLLAQYYGQTAFGSYNDNKSDNAFEIGGGSSSSTRRNLVEVDRAGNMNVLRSMVSATWFNQTYSANYNITGNTYELVPVSLPHPTNVNHKRPIFNGVRISGGTSSTYVIGHYVDVPDPDYETYMAYVQMRNDGSSTSSGTVTAYITWI